LSGATELVRKATCVTASFASLTNTLTNDIVMGVDQAWISRSVDVALRIALRLIRAQYFSERNVFKIPRIGPSTDKCANHTLGRRVVQGKSKVTAGCASTSTKVRCGKQCLAGYCSDACAAQHREHHWLTCGLTTDDDMAPFLDCVVQHTQKLLHNNRSTDFQATACSAVSAALADYYAVSNLRKKLAPILSHLKQCVPHDCRNLLDTLRCPGLTPCKIRDMFSLVQLIDEFARNRADMLSTMKKALKSIPERAVLNAMFLSLAQTQHCVVIPRNADFAVSKQGLEVLCALRDKFAALDLPVPQRCALTRPLFQLGLCDCEKYMPIFQSMHTLLYGRLNLLMECAPHPGFRASFEKFQGYGFIGNRVLCALQCTLAIQNDDFYTVVEAPTFVEVAGRSHPGLAVVQDLARACVFSGVGPSFVSSNDAFLKAQIDSLVAQHLWACHLCAMLPDKAPFSDYIQIAPSLANVETELCDRARFGVLLTYATQTRQWNRAQQALFLDACLQPLTGRSQIHDVKSLLQGDCSSVVCTYFFGELPEALPLMPEVQNDRVTERPVALSDHLCA
jgi:hypothetical protein